MSDKEKTLIAIILFVQLIMALLLFLGILFPKLI